LKWVLVGVAVLVVLFVGYWMYQIRVTNPRVTDSLRTDPNGPTAARVMLITLPSGRTIPVNYLREGDMVYAGADGRWWRELVTASPVTLLICGETLHGIARAVRDDPAHTEDVFKRLRPTSYKWIGGVLIDITLAPGPRSS
jgi:hypothetical protein